jgi:serine protease Do
MSRWTAVILALTAALAAPAVRAQQPAGPIEESVQQAVRAAQEAARQARVEVERVLQETGTGMGWLGVRIRELDQATAQRLHLPELAGALVEGVEPGSPAATAGLEADDVIVEYNGTRVIGVLQLERLVRETPPGRTVAVVVWRGGQRRTLQVHVGSRPELMGGVRMMRPELEAELRRMRERMHEMAPPMIIVQARTPLLGIEVEPISGQLAGFFHVPGGRGLLVREVASGSAADRAGLRAGDVIYQVDGSAVSRPFELQQQVRQKCGAGAVTLGVVRNGAPTTVRVPLDCAAGSAART